MLRSVLTHYAPQLEAISVLARTNVYFAGQAMPFYMENEMYPGQDAPLQSKALRLFSHLSAQCLPPAGTLA